MKDFQITLDNKEYKCNSTSCNATDQSWDISTTFGGIRVGIHIPLDNRITRAKVILFVEAFHEGMRAAFKDQDIDQEYVWNKHHAIR